MFGHLHSSFKYFAIVRNTALSNFVHFFFFKLFSMQLQGKFLVVKIVTSKDKYVCNFVVQFLSFAKLCLTLCNFFRYCQIPFSKNYTILCSHHKCLRGLFPQTHQHMRCQGLELLTSIFLISEVKCLFTYI